VVRSPGANKKAKELGRIAYRLAQAKEVYGVIDVEHEEKHLREFEERGLIVTLLSPFRAAAHENEFSSLHVRYYRRKVLHLRWTKAGDFKVVTFDEGDWEHILWEQPAPIPFE
jgi:hypothetical protein